MIYLEIKDKDENIIFSNIKESHKAIFGDNKSSKYATNKTRGILKVNGDESSIWMISENDDSLFKSAKMFNKTFNIYQSIAKGFYDHYSLMTLSNTHTIATIQAKMSQKMESLIGFNKMRGSYQEVIKNVKNIVEQSPHKTAELICELNKRIEEIDSHLQSLSIISNQTALDLQYHHLKTTLLNIYAPFKNNFNEKNIHVDFERVNTDIKILIDYKILSLVMHHFFDNATKYAKSNHEICFIYSQDNKLVVTMHSLNIKNTDKIFTIGYSGENTDTLAGHGIGMNVIKRGLLAMNMDISVCSEPLVKDSNNGKNTFVISCQLTP